MNLRASVKEDLQTLLDIVNLIVTDRTCHSLLVSIGIKTYFLASNPKADILRLILIRLDAQELAVQRLRLSYVFDGIDECSNTLNVHNSKVSYSRVMTNPLVRNCTIVERIFYFDKVGIE